MITAMIKTVVSALNTPSDRFAGIPVTAASSTNLTVDTRKAAPITHRPGRRGRERPAVTIRTSIEGVEIVVDDEPGLLFDQEHQRQVDRVGQVNQTVAGDPGQVPQMDPAEQQDEQYGQCRQALRPRSLQAQRAQKTGRQSKIPQPGGQPPQTTGQAATLFTGGRLSTVYSNTAAPGRHSTTARWRDGPRDGPYDHFDCRICHFR